MQVGNPSVASVIDELIRTGVDRLVVLPMYPQYSATSSGSAHDAVFHALLKQRRVPALRTVPAYYHHPAYLDPVTHVIPQQLARLPWKPDHDVLSSPGTPITYAQRVDPYATQVQRTTRELIRRLGWPRQTWTQSFQSLFGRDEWLKPYTDSVLEKLARQGAKR